MGANPACRFTSEAINKERLQTIGLLGTRFTMEGDFYAGRLQKKHGLNVLIPPETDRTIVHRIIFAELVLGMIREESRVEFLRIMEELRHAGAEGVIEGLHLNRHHCPARPHGYPAV